MPWRPTWSVCHTYAKVMSQTTISLTCCCAMWPHQTGATWPDPTVVDYFCCTTKDHTTWPDRTTIISYGVVSCMTWPRGKTRLVLRGWTQVTQQSLSTVLRMAREHATWLNHMEVVCRTTVHCTTKQRGKTIQAKGWTGSLYAGVPFISLRVDMTRRLNLLYGHDGAAQGARRFDEPCVELMPCL